MRPVQRGRDDRNLGAPVPGKTLWVEVKRPVSKRQAEAQKAFERFVTWTRRRPVPQDRKGRVTIQTYRKRQADRDKEYTAWKPVSTP